MAALQERAPKELKLLKDYLGNDFPAIGLAPAGYQDRGQYDMSNNTIQVRKPVDNSAEAIAARVPTLLHELVHAAQNKISWERLGATKGADGNYAWYPAKDRKDTKLTALAAALAPNAIQGETAKLLGYEMENAPDSTEYLSYRLSNTEQPAWALGAMVDKDSKRFYPYEDIPRGHLNATRATEFMILLDLANRRLKEVEDEK